MEVGGILGCGNSMPEVPETGKDLDTRGVKGGPQSWSQGEGWAVD